MEIKYNVTGNERKALVGAFSQELNVPTKYLGAPTFAYEVGGYHIDKNGTVTGEDNRGLVADLQGLHDFKAVSEEYDKPLPETEEVPAFKDLTMTGNDELGCPNLNSLYHDYEEPPAYATPESDADNAPDRMIIEVPKAGFTDEALSNLQKLVNSKAAMIMKALGTESLPIEQSEEIIRFPWFSFNLSGDEVRAYSRLIGALCAMAKKLNYVSAKPKETDNEKYAFRCFLLRLGFIGDEYKAERKILLSRLSGNSSYAKKRVKEASE